MTKEVIVSISGDHMVAQPHNTDEPGTLELLTRANYYEKNGKHYVLYDEIVDSKEHVIKNKIKLSGDSCLEIFKTGMTRTHMVFEKGKKNMSLYHTPFGEMLIGVDTKRLDVDVRDDQIDTFVEYELEINEEPMAVCSIHVKIKAAPATA